MQIQYQETDTDLVLRPYYNAANPDVQFSGPAGSGTKDSTTRKGGVYALIKPGAAVNSGSPTAPAPDSGFVGLYVVTLTSGATQVTGSNISTYANAPTFTPLPQVPAAVQSGAYVYARDTGTVNAIAFSLNPAPLAYGEGRSIRVKAAYACTAASTANMNGLGNRPIHTSGGAATQGGEWAANDIIELTEDASSFQLRGVFGASATTSSSATQTAVGDANYTILTGDKRLVTTTALTAPRTWTLPAASAFGIGDLVFIDRVGAISPTTPLTFAPNGLDQIDGSTTGYVIGTPYRTAVLRSDGSSRWTYDRSASPSVHLAGDANVTISAYDSTVATSVALTAARTWTLPAAGSVRAGSSITLTDIFGACSTSFPVTVARAGSDTINGQTSLTLTASYFQVVAVSDGTSRWAIQFIDIAQLQGLFSGTMDGCCSLSVVSTTQIKLLPKGGNTIFINGSMQVIPSAGITAVNVVGGVPAVASTLYYIYDQIVSGTMTLNLSTTGYATDAFGRNNKTGDATQRLVGMAYTNASGQFQNSAGFFGLVNYFNRRGAVFDSGSLPATTISGSTPVPLGNSITFLAWADDVVKLRTSAMYTSGQYIPTLYNYVDGASVGVAANLLLGASGGSVFPIWAEFEGSLAEGVHTVQPYASYQPSYSATLAGRQLVNVRA